MKDEINRIHLYSTDYEMFGDLLKIASVEEKLLEPGNFYGTVNIVSVPNMILSNFHINRKVLQVGSGRPGFITFAIWEPKVAISWRKHDMKKGMIGILWNREHESISGAGINAYPVSIEEETFFQLCITKGYPNIIDHLKRNEVIMIEESKLERLRQLIKYITIQEGISDIIILELLKVNLIDKLFDCLVDSLSDQYSMNQSQEKFALVIDYIHENIREITSVHEICKDTEVPERSLRRWVQKRLDLSPKKYLNLLRLNEVRKELKNNSISQNVSQAAYDLNFWHLGQFSRDYKLLFGELPSETLKLGK